MTVSVSTASSPASSPSITSQTSLANYPSGTGNVIQTTLSAVPSPASGSNDFEIDLDRADIQWVGNWTDSSASPCDSSKKSRQCSGVDGSQWSAGDPYWGMTFKFQGKEKETPSKHL